MKALVKYQPGDGFVGIREMTIPALEDNQVLIKVYACGICGSDIHILHDEFPNSPPVIMGHELSGTVEKVGSSVGDFSSGDRVVTELHTKACGTCRLCRTGNQHVCPSKRPLGSQTDGGFAEYVAVPGSLVHKIPDNVDLLDAAMTEPVAICVHALLEFGDIRSGDFVVVLGPGPIGLISAWIAGKAGARDTVIAGIGRDEPVRLKAARELALGAVVNVEREDLAEVVSGLTAGNGADVVIEASGAVPAINLAVQVVRRQGRIIAIGLTREEQIAFSWSDAVIKETKLLMPFSSTWTSWEQALGLLSRGDIQPKTLISTRPLEEWREAFDDAENARVIKTLLVM
jgi:threonine dehydrogenase-like Zn-dependent dehydrogenase